MKFTRRTAPIGLLSALLAISIVQLIAGLALPSIASAQTPPTRVPYGLNGTPSWQENIALGIDIWSIAHERAQIALLLNRCKALNHRFPSQPAPEMVAASTEVFRWMTGAAYAELPPEPFSSSMRDLAPILIKHAFSAEELTAWEAMRNSPEGQRGLAAREVEAALIKIIDPEVFNLK